MNFLPKRGVIGSALTVAALVLILSFKTPENIPATTGANGANGGNSGGVQIGGTSAQQTQSTSGGKGNFSGQLTGQAVRIPFGTVQVRVTVQNGKVTDVQAVQMPTGDRHTQEISAYAAPQLRSEALQAQSANINTISGATYTSQGYIQSLQSALDQAA